MRRAPERLDAVERRAVADDRDDRPVGQRHPQPGRAGEREAEAAHRGAEEAERLARGQSLVQLRPVDRRLLDDDGVAAAAARRARRGRGRAGSGSPAPGGAGGAAAGTARAVGVIARGTRVGELAAHAGGRREHGELGGAAVHLVGIVG